MRFISTAKSALLIVLLAMVTSAGAHDGKHGDEVVTPLQHQALSDAPGKSGVMAVVAYGAAGKVNPCVRTPASLALGQGSGIFSS